MGFFDRFRKKNAERVKSEELDMTAKEALGVDYKKIKAGLSKEDAFVILNKELKDFFPKEGVWWSHCFKRPTEVAKGNLPCHLRDNAWLSRMFQQELGEVKCVFVPYHFVREFVETSPEFAEARHNYELEIVRWQIDWIISGGSNWSMPEGFDEFSLLFSPDVDVMIRGGVVKTLKEIGINGEVIEEGLEKHADMWRRRSMLRGFSHEFEPVVMFKGSPEKASEEHKENWLCMREYNYYCKHKESVDKYGEPTPYMLLTPEQVRELKSVLDKQNAERHAFVEDWKKKTPATVLTPQQLGITPEVEGDLTGFGFIDIRPTNFRPVEPISQNKEKCE